MAQQITVTSDAPVALKPLLESAIRSELRMLEMGLERTRQRLKAFEGQYGLNSEEFGHRFELGELPESLDFIEWAGEIKTYQILENQHTVLQGVRLQVLERIRSRLPEVAPEEVEQDVEEAVAAVRSAGAGR